MNDVAKPIAVLGLLLAGLLLATGCPESNVLPPSTGQVTVRTEVVNVNPSGRFVDDPVGMIPTVFPDQASFQIRDVIVQPLNPDAANAAGSLPLNLLIQRVNPGYLAQQVVEEKIPLNTGSYRVVGVRFTGIFLDDNSDGQGSNRVDPADWQDPMNPVCGDFVRSFTFALNPNSVLLIDDFGQDVTFNVPAEGGVLTIQVDAEALANAVTYNLSCNNCTCEENYDPMNPSTLDCVCGATLLNPGGAKYFMSGAGFRAAGANMLSFLFE